MVDSLVGNPARLCALCRRETSALLPPPAWRRMAGFRHSGHCGPLDQLAVVRFRPAVGDRLLRRDVSIDVSFPDLQRGPALACGALATVAAARAETPKSAIHLASGLLMDRAGQRMGIRSRPLRRESALSRIGRPFYRVSHAFGLAAAVRRFLGFSPLCIGGFAHLPLRPRRASGLAAWQIPSSSVWILERPAKSWNQCATHSGYAFL